MNGKFSAPLQQNDLEKKYKSQTRGTPSKFEMKERSFDTDVSGIRIAKFNEVFYFMLAKVGTCLQTFCHVYFFLAVT